MLNPSVARSKKLPATCERETARTRAFYSNADALHATRAAVEEGIVAGGGLALLRARSSVKVKGDNADQDAGVKIVLRAVEEPLRFQVANLIWMQARPKSLQN